MTSLGSIAFETATQLGRFVYINIVNCHLLGTACFSFTGSLWITYLITHTCTVTWRNVWMQLTETETSGVWRRREVVEWRNNVISIPGVQLMALINPPTTDLIQTAAGCPCINSFSLHSPLVTWTAPGDTCQSLQSTGCHGDQTLTRRDEHLFQFHVEIFNETSSCSEEYMRRGWNVLQRTMRRRWVTIETCRRTCVEQQHNATANIQQTVIQQLNQD